MPSSRGCAKTQRLGVAKNRAEAARSQGPSNPRPWAADHVCRASESGTAEAIGGQLNPALAARGRCLTFIAPADRCNQRCPACILTEVLDEPVRDFILAPRDYAEFVRQFIDAEVSILSVGFQGYEVTLPQSWPFVEAVFEVAQTHGLRRSFITNGMLLDRHTGRIVALDVHRVSVSLDGADAWVNDRVRGLHGAFLATTRALRRFLEQAPHYAPRIAVVSTLFDNENFESLLMMPSVLGRLGVGRWVVSCAMRESNGCATPIQSEPVLAEWTTRLAEVAEKERIRFRVIDEFGSMQLPRPSGGPVHRVKRLVDPNRLFRVEPTGHVRVGREALEAWDPARARRWNPRRDNAVDLLGCRTD